MNERKIEAKLEKIRNETKCRRLLFLDDMKMMYIGKLFIINTAIHCNFLV